jgi:hypothetical protein
LYFDSCTLLYATSDLAGITVENFCCTHGMHVVQDTQKFKTGTQRIREFRKLDNVKPYAVKLFSLSNTCCDWKREVQLSKYKAFSCK